jgi:hypothetical protein
MNKFVTLTIVVGLGWYGYTKYQASAHRMQTSPTAAEATERAVPTESVDTPTFKCDGRTHCSQMSSCAEATFFVKNCPNTQMDGDNDGIPCEQQWCK